MGYPHRDDGLCLCHSCYSKTPRIELVKEPHPVHPECDECYSYYGYDAYGQKGAQIHYCDDHEAILLQKADRPDRRKADVSQEYAFTLTMPPDYKPKKPIEEVAELICKYGKTNPPYEKPDKWAYVLEHTEAGTPHIHGVYHTPTGRKISNKSFKQYWPLWDNTKKMGQGHQGGYHASVRHGESYDEYMLKEGCVKKS